MKINLCIMQLSFRPAMETDISLITLLAHQIWHEHYPAIITREQIDFMLADRYSADAIRNGMQNGEQFFLAYDGEQAVAYASMEPKAGSVFLSKFYVDVSKHRSGIGEQFFRYLLTQINAGLPMRLQVNRQNIKAVNFYFKMGFIIEKAADFDIGSGFFMNDFVMLRKGA